MSAKHRAVQWNRHKLVYDAIVISAIVLFIGVFSLVTALVWPADKGFSPEVILIRATGACAAVLLHFTLVIGPLSRIEPRLLPVLANRRHLGVLCFLTALTHGALTTGYYHGFGVIAPWRSLLLSSASYGSITAFPFEILGLAALLILFLLAATSHDFWLKVLSPGVWKSLHMLVYLAYTLALLHVALGSMQGRHGPVAPLLLLGGATVLAGAHLIAGWRERETDRGVTELRTETGHWLDVGPADQIPLNRARVVCAPSGERIAVFRHAGGISAVSNVCKHQAGPVGEGQVIDGCITCPWHGWQYRPEDGKAPPPFVEQLDCFAVRQVDGRVQVSASAVSTTTTKVAPNAPGASA